jgi:predicted nucleotide-binding protein
MVGRRSPGPAVSDIRDGLNRGRTQALSYLRAELGVLREGLAHVSSDPTPKPREHGTDVFVVHGDDRQAKVEVARLIERAGLNAIILHEQTNGARTIIEKFEDHGKAAGFAVMLLTPDDVGGPDSGHLRPRARQNVIGEMFDRRRTCGESPQ